MRKSQYIAILLGGAAALTLWNLSSQHESPQGAAGEGEKIYGDAKVCADDGNNAEACAQEFQTAKEEHARQAPKFASAADCEAAGYAKCEEAPRAEAAAGAGSSSFFMPMMMGYMMGRMGGPGGGIGGAFAGGAAASPGSASAPAAGTVARAGRPVYADRNGYLYSGGGQVGRVAPGTTSLGSRAVARGGFGATAGRFSGGS
jgi:uncharacterized protein YgiB involved in biofilm formation